MQRNLHLSVVFPALNRQKTAVVKTNQAKTKRRIFIQFTDYLTLPIHGDFWVRITTGMKQVGQVSDGIRVLKGQQIMSQRDKDIRPILIEAGFYFITQAFP